MFRSRTWTYGVLIVVWVCCSLLLAGAQNSITEPTEVQALGAIRASLTDPNKNLTNWNRGDPCTSNWTGVTCYNTTLEDGYLHVQKLDFMWNNISGSIPKEIGNIKTLVLLLLNGNKLTGSLPEELGYLPNLDRIQIDENNISGPLPVSFSNLNKTKHFHMNNNSISGQIPPELSILPNIFHLLLDNNKLSGHLPPELSQLPNLKILQLDNNNFGGNSIPMTYSNMSQLFKLSLRNCNLQGPIPDLSRIPNLYYVDLGSNQLNGSIPQNRLSQNITTVLKGNPFCSTNNLVQFCGSVSNNEDGSPVSPSATSSCSVCQPPSELNPAIPDACFCAAPLVVGYRLKSPGFSHFLQYRNRFENHLTHGLKISLDQLYLASFVRQGPRLRMTLKIFPAYVADNQSSPFFNRSEIQRVMNMFKSWDIPNDDLVGPCELISLSNNYNDVKQTSSSLSKGALVGIILGTIAAAVTLSAVVSILILRVHTKKYHTVARRRRSSKALMRINGVKAFTFGEMGLATNNFNSSTQIGQGGYGMVYKGILADGTVVAIKRAEEGSLQGEKEFLTEIELLSRLHHRNLVSLIGYCEEEGEQMLVYEFMSNGTLRDNLTARTKEPMSFDMRLRIALGSAKGILYLHTEANPPIFHRDIKASNILLDPTFTAKVADFGLSRLAPVPIEGSVPAHVSTVVKGTPGYLDPEYFLTHQLTDKSDVYSLGVVFLELLTAMQPISHGKNIVREVKVAYESGMIFSIIDGRMGFYPADSVVKFVNLALKCCRDETNVRPSMAEVVRELENIMVMMPESEIKIVDPMITGVGKVVTPPSSSSNPKNPFMSMDLSGSNLDSGVVPTIAPR